MKNFLIDTNFSEFDEKGNAVHTVKFNEAFEGGSLAVNFKFKLNSKSAVFTVYPLGCNIDDSGVRISCDELTVGNREIKITTAHIKPTEVPVGEWCNADIVYTFEHGRVGAMAVVTDMHGAVLASVALKVLAKAPTDTAFGLEFLSCSETEGAAWQIKELTAQANPLTTGDTMQGYRREIMTATGYKVNFLQINGFHTIRPYLGEYAFLPDLSGMICGTADGSFYRYDFETELLTYLDRTTSMVLHLGSEFSTAMRLPIYVNPTTGNVFYKKRNDKGNYVLCKINPKTLEKSELYEETDSKTELQLATTADERYVSYQIGGVGAAGVMMKIGRINLQTGEKEYERELTYNSTYAVNHIIINPMDPSLVHFHRESHVGVNERDHTNILNLVTGEKITYAQPGNNSAHATWVYGGECVAVSDFCDGIFITILNKDLQCIVRKRLPQGSHTSADESLTWVLGDDFGIDLINVKTEKLYNIARYPDDTVAPYIKLNDPFHGHSEISRNGTLLNWGGRDADGVLGVVWMRNPDME